MPDGTWVMDSWKIADLLEEKYPEPSLHLDSEYIPRLKKLLPGAIMALRSIYAPGVYNNVLSPASEEFFRRTREENFGKTLEEVAKDGGEPAWKAAEPNLQKITALLEENTEGPFFDGKTVGFADFVWAGYLIFFGRIGEDVFDRALKASGNASTHLKLLEALKPWTERDDH
ncbi:hypothetical protein GGR54DRAFT_601068 [Hypoxylon sp. NC1633]|nr:hypothetical protein GGR54DRAFT_601068 [Hypoxylon sp. NC1633]